jgi:hypothetical protein
MVGTDPSDPDQRAVAVSKSNLGPRPAARRFTLDAGRFLWDPEAARDLTAEDLFGSRHSENDRERQSAADKAKDRLFDFLARGPRAARECHSEAKKAGISKKTVERAKRGLGVRSHRLGKAEENKWEWHPPDNHEPQKGTHGHLGHVPESGTMQGLYKDRQDGQDGHGSFFKANEHNV